MSVTRNASAEPASQNLGRRAVDRVVGAASFRRLTRPQMIVEVAAPLVLVQLRLEDEDASAELAVEGRRRRVRMFALLVVEKTRFLAEGRIAKVAIVSDALVQPQMLRQIATRLHRLLAKRTLVAQVQMLRAMMFVQMGLVEIDLFAELTGKLLALGVVRGGVDGEVVGGGKVLLANGTLVDGAFVPTSHVLLQVLVLTERLAAVRTSEGFNGVGNRFDAKVLLLFLLRLLLLWLLLLMWLLWSWRWFLLLLWSIRQFEGGDVIHSR